MALLEGADATMLRELHRTGSIGKVAAVLGVDERAVRERVVIIERQVGMDLFDFRQGKAQATAAGEALAEWAMGLTDAIGDAERAAAEHGAIGTEVLQVMCTDYAASYLLPHVLGAFAETSPTCSVELIRCKSAADAIGRLQAETGPTSVEAGMHLDLRAESDSTVGAVVVCEDVIAPPVGIESACSYDDRMVAVCSRSHELASRTIVSLTALERERVVIPAEGSDIRAAIDGLFGRQGVHPAAVIEASDAATLMCLAALRRGVGVLPERVARSLASDSVAVRHLHPTLPYRTHVYLDRRRLSRVSRIFAETFSYDL